MRDLVGQARFLRARHQMVEQDADPAVGPGLELVEHRAQVVGTVETLDHDAFDAQVVAPHLLDQLGVVHTFHQDPRRVRDPGARRRPRGCPTPCASSRRRARSPDARGAPPASTARRGGPRCRRPRTRRRGWGTGARARSGRAARRRYRRAPPARPRTRWRGAARGRPGRAGSAGYVAAARSGPSIGPARMPLTDRGRGFTGGTVRGRRSRSAATLVRRPGE